VQYLAHAAIDSGQVNYRTTFGYDAAGRKTSVQTPDPSNPGSGTVTALTCYTPRGEVAMKIDASHAVTANTYLNQSGMLDTVTDPLGMTYNSTTPCSSAAKSGTDTHRGATSFGYDGRGNRTSRATWNDALSAQITEGWAYDGANRPTGYTSNTGTAAITTSTSYTIASGRLTGKTTKTGSTGDSSLRQIVDTFAPSGVVTQEESDICGSSSTCSGITNDAAHKTIINTGYDPLGRPVTLKDNSPGVSNVGYTMAYNTAGNVTSLTYPNAQTVTAAWNLSGQATNQIYPNGAQYRYRYDPRLALAYVDNFYITYNNYAAYTRDSNGQITSETLTAGNAGSKTWRINPATGRFDAYQQTIGSNTINTAVTYDSNGRVATDCKSTGTSGGTPSLPSCQSSDIKTSYGYDNAGQLASASVANDSTTGHLIGWTYSYGNRGNRLTQTATTKTSGGTSAVTTNYLYNPNAAELCAAKTGSAAPSSCTDSSATSTWTYDGAGRRTQAVTAASTINYTIDPRGNPAAIAATIGGTTTTQTRGYDPLGQWNCATGSAASNCAPGSAVNTSNNIFYYDNTGATGAVPQMLQSSLSWGSFWYIYGADRVSGIGGYLGTDYLGSTVGPPGATDRPTSYSPFGEALDNMSAVNFNYRSEYKNGPELYLRARSYDASVGAFTQRDPLDGVNGTTTVANPYHYVNNDPLNETDPTGMRPKDDDLSTSADTLDPFSCIVGPDPAKVLSCLSAMMVNPHITDGIKRQLQSLWEWASSLFHGPYTYDSSHPPTGSTTTVPPSCQGLAASAAAGLPGAAASIRAIYDVGRVRTVAVAAFCVDKMFGIIGAKSGEKDTGRAGLVDMPSAPVYQTQVIGHPRDFDAEVKILENARLRFVPGRSTGVFYLHADNPTCLSCAGVIGQFEAEFPGILFVPV